MKRVLSVVVLLAAFSACGSPRLMSPKEKGVQVNAAMAKVFIAPRHYFLTWDFEWPLPNPYVEFDVERTDDLRTWVVVATVKQPPVEIQPGLYRVGAHEIVPIE